MAETLRFRYKAVDQGGRDVSSEVAARSERDALRALDAQGLTVVSLQPAAEDARRFRRAKASTRELQLVLQEFATLLEAGVTLVVALGSLAKSSHHPQLTNAFRSMERAVRRGESFSAAFRDAGLPLPPYFLQLVEAGEATGRLAEAFESGVRQYQYDQQVAGELRSALVYPLVLVGSGISAVLIIFLWVVPRFGGLLAQHGDRMPTLSRWVIGSGVWLSDHVWLVAAVVAVACAGLYAVLSRPSVRTAAAHAAVRLPLVGDWMVEAEVGRWSSTLSALLAGRVELLRALALAAESVQLEFLRNRLQRVARAVKGGTALSVALREHNALNPTGYDLVAVGEASGELPKLLAALARLYETTGRDRMKRVLQLIEPIAIILIGIVIGVIVTAIILAITSVNDVPM